LRRLTEGSSEPEGLKGTKELSDDFSKKYVEVLESPQFERWERATKFLKTDPILADECLSPLEDLYETLQAAGYSSERMRQGTFDIFYPLSSGHKIILNTLISLVQHVEEKTLVLIDEPETHLHPPLLAAFIRAVSDMLVLRNAVAIIATHSPVVLQEVPKSCVKVLERVDDSVTVRLPATETFAENLGSLTHHVFGLEVRESGFHREIKNLFDRQKNEHGDTYENVLHSFNDALGGEGKAILQALIAAYDGANE